MLPFCKYVRRSFSKCQIQVTVGHCIVSSHHYVRCCNHLAAYEVICMVCALRYLVAIQISILFFYCGMFIFYTLLDNLHIRSVQNCR